MGNIINNKINMFISYCHKDKGMMDSFSTHLAPLIASDEIDVWSDRRLQGGDSIQNVIHEQLESKAEIICLLLSANYLASDPCLAEMRSAIKRNNETGVSVIPIILSACSWMDNVELNQILALPTDANPVESHQSQNEAWNNVLRGIKKVIQDERNLNSMSVSEEFVSFLNSTELLEKAHAKKEKVLLDDIFVYPMLTKNDVAEDEQKVVNAREVIKSITENSKVMIAGDDQSGKTTLCKKIYKDLITKRLFPVYLTGKEGHYKGKIENQIENAIRNQYSKNVHIKDERMVIILDDFHLAKDKEKQIEILSGYKFQILLVDDIFGLNIKNDSLLKSYTRFSIQEASPSLRNELIIKWLRLSDKDGESYFTNEEYQEIDKATVLVNTSLGKVFGAGVMPAHPFFILSIMSIYETFDKPLNEDITSQGYCYQAFIYTYLRKQGVRNDEIDTYINFLTEISFFFYREKKKEIPKREFKIFMEQYLAKFNLPVKEEVLLQRLQRSKIIVLDSCNNYSFYHSYLYFFFVARYLANNLGNSHEEIKILTQNLHKNEYAYIAIFISHHSKSNYFLDEIIKNASSLFGKYKAAALFKKDVLFFDTQIDSIVKAALPSPDSTPEQARKKQLEHEDVIEKNNSTQTSTGTQSEDNELGLEIRRSVKTVEVLGSIIRNHAGSLEKKKIEEIFREALFVYLRILSSFLNFVELESNNDHVVKIISERLDDIIKKNNNKKNPKELSKEDLESISKNIFWNINFFIVFGFINKAIDSLGSNKVIKVIEDVCNGIDTPVAHVFKHGALMKFEKNVQVDSISKLLSDSHFSEISKRMLKFMVVFHCHTHPVDYRTRQRIATKMNIQQVKLRTIDK